MYKKRKLMFYAVIFAVIMGASSFVSILAYHSKTQIPLQLIKENLEFPTVTQVSAPQLSPEADIIPLDVVWDMLGQVNQDRALDDLRQLTGEEPICLGYGCYTIIHRLTGSQGLNWAQDYLYENLVDLGYDVEFIDWSSSGLADQNLIARKDGVLNPTEEVYFVSHVDGFRSYETNFPAADDNASSVVNGLELARIMSNYEFERTLVLFFSSGEEQSALGVKAYLDQLSPEELGAIKYVVNRDMTGYDGNGDRVMELFHGGHPPSIALTQMMSEIIEAYQLNLVPIAVAGCP
jgi:Peptidase family M28